jgi:hypothetical protein
MTETEIAERQTWYREDDADAREVLAELATADYVYRGVGPRLNIYTKAKGIDRAEAERMLAFWMLKEHGIRNPKFVWNRPEFIVEPMGFGDY